MTTGQSNTEHEQPRLIEWMPLSAKSARVLTRQLKREIPHEGHVLSSERFVIIAKNANHDDVLLALPDGPRWAACHMTWSKSRERAPWPATRVSESLADLMHEA